MRGSAHHSTSYTPARACDSRAHLSSSRPDARRDQRRPSRSRPSGKGVLPRNLTGKATRIRRMCRHQAPGRSSDRRRRRLETIVGRSGRLAVKIRERALSIGIGAASVREIDRVNIYQATVVAMRRTLSRLTLVPNHVVVDGTPFRTLETPRTAIVGGDDLCHTIACASIIAKVTRDRIMHELAGRHPNYLWERNVGYSALAHLKGLPARGVTPHHRMSFCPVRQLSLEFDAPGAPAIDVLSTMLQK
jgi:ribonuclease HII